jgi:hypothetical protein
MTYFDDYKNRLSLTGQNESDAIKNDSINFINSSFKNSPTYRIIKVNGIDVDSRVLTGNDSNIIKILFRPDTLIDIGSNLVIEDKKWLITDVVNKVTHPKAEAQRCNEALKWKDNIGNIFNHPCVVTTSKYTVNALNAGNRPSIENPEGNVYIYVQLNDETKNIKHSQRFILGSQVYEIIGIDDLRMIQDNVGVIEFTARISNKNVSDDFSEDIAENDINQREDGVDGGRVLW